MRFLVFIILVLTGCTQLMNGAAQPVMVKNGNDMFTTCSGAVEDWGSCNDKARKTCANGYNTIKREESPVGGKRELTFQCK